jgi:hypothetical protein
MDATAKKGGVGLTGVVRKAILSALSERDETAAICRDKDGNPEPNPELRDTESVPLGESVEAFFAREVQPHVPDVWIDTERRDPRTARSASSAMRSTSIAISTATSRPDHWRRSRPTSVSPSRRSCACWRK